MMSGAKVINHDVLAHEWLYDLMTRPNIRIKVGCIPHDIRILGRIVGVRSTEQSVWHLMTLTSQYRIITLFLRRQGIKNARQVPSFRCSAGHFFNVLRLLTRTGSVSRPLYL